MPYVDENASFAVLATLCKALLPVIRECLYNDIRVTDRNIAKLLSTSRQLAYSNLSNVQYISFERSTVKGNMNEAMYAEMAAHLRPVSLRMSIQLKETTLEKVDVSRLRRLSCSTNAPGLGSLLQRASGSLGILTLSLDRDEQHFSFPEGSASMTALKRMKLDDSSFSAIPRDFFSFLTACTQLSRLYIYSQEPAVVDRIVKLCGHTLTTLEALIQTLRPYSHIETSLAKHADRLETLRLHTVQHLFLSPYPATLRRLECHAASVAMAAIVLKALKKPNALPPISFLCVQVACEVLEYEGDRATAIITKLAAECQRQGITFSSERGEGWDDY